MMMIMIGGFCLFQNDLKGLDTLGRFSAIFYKGNNFLTVCFQNASEKWSALKEKNLLPSGANSFLLE